MKVHNFVRFRVYLISFKCSIYVSQKNSDTDYCDSGCCDSDFFLPVSRLVLPGRLSLNRHKIVFHTVQQEVNFSDLKKKKSINHLCK